MDVLVWWTVPAPKPHPWDSEVIDSEEDRDLLRARLQQVDGTGVHVSMGKDVLGVAGCILLSHGYDLFRGLCQMESLNEGKDYTDLKSTDTPPQILVKQDLFAALLCRAWARRAAVSKVRPLLQDSLACPFAEESRIELRSDSDISDHYYELLLGRGPKEKCPLAEKYLQGVARDMRLSEQPYFQSVLAGRCDPNDSILSILKMLDVPDALVPLDVRQELALGVACKVLELIQVTGLDL